MCSDVVVSIIDTWVLVSIDIFTLTRFPIGVATEGHLLSGMRDQGDSCIGCAMLMRMFGNTTYN